MTGMTGMTGATGMTGLTGNTGAEPTLRVTSPAYAATIDFDADLYDFMYLNATGNFTFGLSGTPTNGSVQRLRVKKGISGIVITPDASIIFGSDLPTMVLNTTISTYDELAFVYNSTLTKWEFVSINRGFA